MATKRSHRGGASGKRHGRKKSKEASSRDKSEEKSGRERLRKGRFGRPAGARQGGRTAVNMTRPKKHEPSEEVKQWAEETRDDIKQWLLEASQIKSRPFVDLKKDPLGSLDSWQRDAVDALIAGQSVVVDAPTTAGKTRVVESYFSMNIGKNDFRAAYTTPVKSLANDKLHEFREMFGRDNVGISTGDVKENLGAPIVVATLESYRNSLLGTEPDLDRNLVVFDEYHYVQDLSRGSAWEEAIILTPPSCQLLLLSASVGNSSEFCDWLNKIRNQSCTHVSTLGRPVPLTDLVYFQGAWVRQSLVSESAWKRIRIDGIRPLPSRYFAERVVAIEDMDLLPCIVYAGRRKSCEVLAENLCESAKSLTEDQRVQMSDHLQELHQEFRALAFLPPRLRSMIMSSGVAYHHSGLAPQARLAVERLLKQGKLRFCAATMGLSLGINFSVRSAVISDFSRPDERGMVTYEPSEVLQMLGRAGRRGRDVVGFSLWPTPESFRKLGQAERTRCDSRLKNDPTTFLGLVGRGYGLRGIERFYSKSFLRYNDAKVNLGMIHPARMLKRLQVDSLPCSSPAAEYAQSLRSKMSLCGDCKLRKTCHAMLKTYRRGSLAALHLHLHRLGALDGNEALTNFGSIARYFPQSGGLLVAKMVVDGRITASNISRAAELCAGLALARHKQPFVPESYRWPFDEDAIEIELQQIYPESLFPELYDKTGGRRREPGFRDFNPSAGYVANLWLQGVDWGQLMREVTTPAFGAGDLTSLLLRVGTYLQSLTSIPDEGLADGAKWLRQDLLRDPISIGP